MTRLVRKIIFFFAVLSSVSFSQDVTLEYIFQDTNIINPRPSLRFINSASNKIYYYADDDFNGSLDLFEFDYFNNEYYKFADTILPSEYVVLAGGDAVSVIEGDIYISKNFTHTRTFSRDVQITKTDEYEFSPTVRDNLLVFRRKGNYFVKLLDSLSVDELQLTKDESDSISYQLFTVSEKPGNDSIVRRLFLVRYDNSTKHELLFPDYTDDFVKVRREKRGLSKIKLLECEIYYKSPKKIDVKVDEITYPDNIRYSTQYAAYSPDTKTLMLDAETIERHDRKIFNYDINSKSIKEIYSESDTAWIERHDNPIRFINNDEVIFESETSGYNNLYSVNKDGTGLKKIAGGNFTIYESVLDYKYSKVYYTANPRIPVSYSVYELDLKNGDVKEISQQLGFYRELHLSQDGNYLVCSHSYMTQPEELFLIDFVISVEIQLTKTISPKFKDIQWTHPELISFNNKEDGQEINAFLYKPKNFNPKKKYPLICFAHGAGYLQNVTLGFSPYQDNFMVNTFITNNDYIVLDVDFRGSFGYGRDFRNKTYRNLGYWEVSDYISGIEFLDSLGYINRDKVGIYGGSYGGFVTLMALLRHPEYFKCGIALRAVSDWANYYYSNWWYVTARLGVLTDSTRIYYEQSSPITYADNLQVPLLMTHGMLDDNVFFQDMVQLTQKLIDNKKDFEVMFYPKEFHSFRLQSSWLDQYKRIFNFFEKYLK